MPTTILTGMVWRDVSSVSLLLKVAAFANPIPSPNHKTIDNLVIRNEFIMVGKPPFIT
jgi:hypothetical protein